MKTKIIEMLKKRKLNKLGRTLRIILGSGFFVASLFLSVYWFFLALFFIFWVFRFDTKYLGYVAITLLVSIPALQYFKHDSWAEQIAVYVYFLLCIIVAIQIIDFQKSDENIENKITGELEK
jgi:glycerol-3-phosphate acyltransferase PlsY